MPWWNDVDSGKYEMIKNSLFLYSQKCRIFLYGILLRCAVGNVSIKLITYFVINLHHSRKVFNYLNKHTSTYKQIFHHEPRKRALTRFFGFRILFTSYTFYINKWKIVLWKIEFSRGKWIIECHNLEL